MIDCECVEWGRDLSNLTNHHPNCKSYDLKGDVKKIIEDLIIGIDAWASDEDGIHPECFDAYEKACILIGHKLPSRNEY